MEAPSRHEVLGRRTGRSSCVEFPIRRCYQKRRGFAAAVELLTGPFLVVAPTMRVPGDSRGTINAYLAMRAALVAVLDHNGGEGGRIASVAAPGLCTGVGWMSADESAVQMRAAHDMIVG